MREISWMPATSTLARHVTLRPAIPNMLRRRGLDGWTTGWDSGWMVGLGGQCSILCLEGGDKRVLLGTWPASRFYSGDKRLAEVCRCHRTAGSTPCARGQSSHPLGPSRAAGKGQQEPHKDKHKVLPPGKKDPCQQGRLGQLCCKAPGDLGGQRLNWSQQCAPAPKASWAA